MGLIGIGGQYRTDILLGIALGAVFIFINQAYPQFVLGYPQELLWGSVFWSSVILAPVVEEAAFRGILLPLVGATTKGFLIVAAIFSLFHMFAYGAALTSAFFGAFVVGLVACYVAAARGSLTAVIIMHGIFNWWLTAGRASIFTG